MERYIIYKHNGEKINLFGSYSPIKITKGEQRKKRLGENTVSLTLESVKPINFSIRDKITVFAEDYFLNLMPTARKTGERRFSYDVVFESIQYDIAKIVFLDEDLSNKSTDSRFPLRANLKEILEIIINNLNRDNPGLFRLGSYPETDIRNFQYSDNNCLAILQQTCEAYETEFEIKKDGESYIINIGTIGRMLPLSFRYGLGGGAYEISRQTVDSSNIVTRLFTYGSDKNLPSNYRNFASRLRLGLNEKSYIEDTEAIKAFGIIEGVKSFDEIYPHREGIVTGINVDILSFTDSGMDFDLNEKDANGTKYLIDGTSAKITFNTGGLAGYTFEIVKDGGYNHATKTFKLIQYKDERGFVFPNQDATTFQIKVGDKYVITDIYPPQSYITAAEDKLLAKAKEYLKGNSAPRVQYSIKILERFLKKYAGSQTSNIFEIGDYVGVIDKDVNIDRSGDNAIRINAFTRDLIGHTPYAYTLEVSDTLEVDVIERIISEQNKVDTIIKINDLSDVYKNKRSYKTTQELLNMVFDQEGYFNDGNIRPNSIETQMLSVGAKAQQMILRNTVIEANYQGNGNVVRVTGGTLVHYGLFDTPKTWNITTLTTTITTGNGAVYIYARCPKGEGDAVILFEPEQKKVEDSNFYYFIVGVLHSLEDGVRWISLTYGTSSINGAFIKTGKIVSSDGQNYIDLDNNQMRLGDNNSAVEWNKNGDKTLRLKGTMVVSPSGDESPAEVDRGNYDNSKIYYAGDKVSYNGRVFLCIRNTSAGIVPTNTTYWKPYSGEVVIGGVNLLRNTNFPSGVSYWMKTGSVNMYPTPNVKPPGSNNNTLYIESDKVGSGTNNILTQPTKRLEVGKTYTLSFWAAIHMQSGNLHFEVWGGIGSTDFAVPSGWRFYTHTFTVTKDNPDQSLYFWINKAGAFYLNSIQLEEGNTATAWKPAPEDVQAEIDAAQTAANNAKSSADAATNRLNDWASDSIISPTEKTALRQQLADIQSEYQEIASQTSKYSLTSSNEWASYYTAYNLAVSALTKYTAVNPENISVGSDYSNIAAYYPKRQSILDLIASTTKSYAEKLVNDIQIGGRNYFKNSTPVTAFTVTPGSATPTIYSRFQGGFQAIGNVQNDAIFYMTNVFNKKGWHNVSFKVKTAVVNWRNNIVAAYNGKDLTIGQFWATKDTDNYVSLSFKIEEELTTPISIWIQGASAQLYTFTDIMFENGNKASSYSDAPEDVQAKITALDYLKTALANRTEIDGGLLLTSLLKLGTFSGQTFNEKSGINGTATNASDVIAWFGGTLQEAIQNLASIVFRMDGSGQLAKGNISWNGLGDVSMLGNFIGKIATIHDGNRIEVDPTTNSIKMYNNVNGTDLEIINISWENIGFGLRRPKLVMKEYSSSDYSVMSSVIISTQKIGFYRYGDENAPYFEVAGDNYSQKRIRIGSFVLPTSKPTTSITMWRDGENLKITP